MDKNITLIGINFYPEDTSTGLYTTQMAEDLSENGFNVSVITGFPYYPQWEIWEEYKNKPKYLEEEFKGIKIYRYKQFTPKNPNFKNRVKHILSFTLGSFRNLKKIKKSDLIIAIVPFTFDVWLAHKLAKKTKAKVWVHIQDFEFDAAFETGVIENNKLKKITSKLLYRIETNLLDKADIVSSISYSMLEKAKKKTKSELFYFPNWIDEDFINPEKADVHPYLKSNKFKVLYSGNIGAKQDWEIFIKVVSYFKSREDIEFIVVGNGAKKDWLLSQIKNFKNVKYYAPVPYKDLPDLLCSTDLHILFQKSEVVDTVMPSKLLGMMASAKPSLVTGNLKSEVAKVIKESQGGEFFDSNDIKSIINFIEELNKNIHLAKNYGKNARQYIIEHFSKEKVLGNLKNKIKEILSN
ncbi:WcaI family glycosyltransferase [Desulfurobacterium thermolithotrophum]|uniref:WcaI family glycosyltransferase n=1 Tax=Desulfurobacterium thermolithotrophum TaxID=64160 RepID=UPI0013D18C89|nr:WcaI family glycosyltransferase [Desulfurobacterium thermolithotrophum]